jgi:hypothetical protein
MTTQRDEKNLTMPPLTRANAGRNKGAMLHWTAVTRSRGVHTTGGMVGFDATIL